jgi:integral membrane protein
MDAWTSWRLVKWVFLALLASGLLPLVGSADRRTRVLALYGYVVPGLVGVWVAGWALMKATSRSMGEPWIPAAMATSALGLGAAMWTAHRPGSKPVAALVGAGMLAAVGIMTTKSPDPAVYGLAGVLGAVAGAAVVWPAVGACTDTEAREAVVRGFRWLAWSEGVSLILLLGIATPLKYSVGIELDGGNGAIGWAHGVLLLVYLQSLFFVGRELAWSWGTMAFGFAAALLPAGTFVFERRAL